MIERKSFEIRILMFSLVHQL